MKFIKLFETFDETEYMRFYHGGDLDDYKDFIPQKSGRYEYGAGLYLTTRLETAQKYSKGSRKLYMVSIKKGNDISDSYIDENKVLDFIKENVVRSKQTSILQYMKKYTENGKVDASVFNNLILNHKGIPSSKTNILREFLVSNNIDYEIVNNPFGFGSEVMLVLYNMDLILNYERLKNIDYNTVEENINNKY
jgi:hypothetical protein